MMKKHLALALLLAACGTSQPPVSNASSGAGNGTAPVKDTRTELERRHDAACETLGPKITSCAVEDAKRDLAAGKIKQEQFDKDTASGILEKNTEEFIDKCRANEFSSRQVRVLEVCQQQETDCEPLLACLDNLKKQ